MSSEECINSQYHPHPLSAIKSKSTCCVCFRPISPKKEHYQCKDCEFDICCECIEENLNESENPIDDFLNLLSIEDENFQASLDIINHKKESNFSIPFISHAISRSRPKFYLFEEQMHLPHPEDYEIEATRQYVDKNGNTIYYFSSSQAQKMVGKCQQSLETFINNHKPSLVVNRDYPLLRQALNGDDLSSLDMAEFALRNIGTGLTTSVTLGIVSLIEYFGFSPTFDQAMAAAHLKRYLSKATKGSGFGCITVLTKDFHIHPCGTTPFTSLFPDHKLEIDWSTTDSLPLVISIITNIKKLYMNSRMTNNHVQLNLLFSAADYIEDGLNLMMQNPLFSDKKLISFAFYSVQILQAFLRISQKPLTVSSTTILNVYQSDSSGDRKSHSFLNVEEFFKIQQHLIPDIREELTKLNEGKVFDIDLKNPELSINFLNPLISKAEVRLLEFYASATMKIIEVGKLVPPSFQNNLKIMTELLGTYYTIQGLLDETNSGNNNKKVVHHPNNQLSPLNVNDVGEQVSNFLNGYSPKLKDTIQRGVKNAFISDFYNKQFCELKKEVADLKHLKQLILLASEIERRKNDANDIFHIDLAIESNEDCVYKYHVNVIV